MLEYYPIDFTIERFALPNTEPFKSITNNNIFKSSIDKIVSLLNTPLANANTDDDSIKATYIDIHSNFDKIILKLDHPNNELTINNVRNKSESNEYIFIDTELSKISSDFQKLIQRCKQGTNGKKSCSNIKNFSDGDYEDVVTEISTILDNNLRVKKISPDEIKPNTELGNNADLKTDINDLVDEINKSKSTIANTLTIENIKLINSLIQDLVTKINKLGTYDSSSYIRLFDIVFQLKKIDDTLKTLNISITNTKNIDKIFNLCNTYAKNPDSSDPSHKITFPDTMPSTDAEINYYLNCNISTYKHIVPNSLWYYYVNTDAGRKNSKWVKNNLKFSKFRLDDTSNPYEIFNGKKSSWSIHTKEDWKTNPFTKYIKKTKINTIILIVLILISLITLTIFYNKQIAVVIIIITVLHMFRVIHLILGNGKLKEKDFKEDIASEPPSRSFFKQYTESTGSTDSTDIQNKAKLFPRVFNKLFFYDITSVNKPLKKADYNNIKTKLAHKYNSYLAFLIILSLSVIGIIVCIYSNIRNLIIGVIVFVIILIVSLYAKFSNQFKKKLPLELQTNKNISLPMAVYCNNIKSTSSSTNKQNNKQKDKENKDKPT